jgi:DNA-binding NtrC family response regulator
MANFVTKPRNDGVETDLSLREKFVLRELDGYVKQNNNLPKIGLLRRLSELMLAEVENIDQDNGLRFGEGFRLDEYLENCEKDIIRYALYISGNNQLITSRLLGMKPTTLNMKLKRYHLHESSREQSSPQLLRRSEGRRG